MKHAATVVNGGGWVTDCAYLPLSRRMVFASMDRAISTYDMNRWGALRQARICLYGRGPGGYQRETCAGDRRKRRDGHTPLPPPPIPCRGSYDLTGRVYASGAMGTPLSLAVLAGDAGERVVYGDTSGGALLLLCGGRELPARDLISTDDHKVGVGRRVGGGVGANTQATASRRRPLLRSPS